MMPGGGQWAIMYLASRPPILWAIMLTERVEDFESWEEMEAERAAARSGMEADGGTEGVYVFIDEAARAEVMPCQY